MITLNEEYIQQELEHINTDAGEDKTRAKYISEMLENRYSMSLCFLLSRKFQYIIDAVEYIELLENKMEIKKEGKPKRLTVYEKFLRLPKVLISQKLGVSIEYDFDIHFETKFNDECSIEYTHYDPHLECYTQFRSQDTNEDVSWSGTFEECVEKAYAFFKKHGGLLEDENVGITNHNEK